MSRKVTRRRRHNPLTGSGVLSVTVLIVMGGAAYLAWQWWQQNRDKFIPKSAAEKQVDELYGPTQAWAARPVYNTPDAVGYFPTLPASYAPGTPASAMRVPPGVIESTQPGYTEPSIWKKLFPGSPPAIH